MTQTWTPIASDVDYTPDDVTSNTNQRIQVFGGAGVSGNNSAANPRRAPCLVLVAFPGFATNNIPTSLSDAETSFDRILCNEMLSRGWVVAVIELTPAGAAVTGGGAAHLPSHANFADKTRAAWNKDVVYGIQYLKAHAGDYGIDPHRVYGVGLGTSFVPLAWAALRPFVEAEYGDRDDDVQYGWDPSLAGIVSVNPTVHWKALSSGLGQPVAASAADDDVAGPLLANISSEYLDGFAPFGFAASNVSPSTSRLCPMWMVSTGPATGTVFEELSGNPIPAGTEASTNTILHVEIAKRRWPNHVRGGSVSYDGFPPEFGSTKMARITGTAGVYDTPALRDAVAFLRDIDATLTADQVWSLPAFEARRPFASLAQARAPRMVSVIVGEAEAPSEYTPTSPNPLGWTNRQYQPTETIAGAVAPVHPILRCNGIMPDPNRHPMPTGGWPVVLWSNHQGYIQDSLLTKVGADQAPQKMLLDRGIGIVSFTAPAVRGTLTGVATSQDPGDFNPSIGEFGDAWDGNGCHVPVDGGPATGTPYPGAMPAGYGGGTHPWIDPLWLTPWRAGDWIVQHVRYHGIGGGSGGDELPIDPTRVGMFGNSSGAHIATWAGLFGDKNQVAEFIAAGGQNLESSRPNCLALLNPCWSFRAWKTELSNGGPAAWHMAIPGAGNTWDEPAEDTAAASTGNPRIVLSPGYFALQDSNWPAVSGWLGLTLENQAMPIWASFNVGVDAAVQADGGYDSTFGVTGTTTFGITHAHSAYTAYWLRKHCPLSKVVVNDESLLDALAVSDGGADADWVPEVITSQTARWISMVDYIENALALDTDATPWNLVAPANDQRRSHVEVISWGDYGVGGARLESGCQTKGAVAQTDTTMKLDNGLGGNILPIPPVGTTFFADGDSSILYTITAVDENADSGTATEITFQPPMAPSGGIADNTKVLLQDLRYIEVLVTEDSYKQPSATAKGVLLPVYPRAGGLQFPPTPYKLTGIGAVWMRSPTGLKEVAQVMEV